MTTLGAIARKPGITWGGAWVGSIDLPHFEVKTNWIIPKGYKLEGQVIVPSNSKYKVQLIEGDKKEEFKVTQTWNPGSPALQEGVENIIKWGVDKKHIQAQHLTAL
ncbi:hypothetical protein H131_21732 [Lysinibacillus sphaericus OT4b.31]|uniref:Peptidase M15C domain-containing protein n=1 Tax=Lysinibacillus sphaericus OT4b.31 TaxID=1285586 RepID=R7Z8U0_LYSSH|nr:hypothetical protein H131_21732 [Lysinibacillus sphaericus OT4b.31]